MQQKIFLASASLAIVGTFFPWIDAGLYRSNGIRQEDGIVFLILMLVAIAVYFSAKNKPTLKNILLIIIGTISLFSFFTTLDEVDYLRSHYGDLVSFGGGIYLSALGSLAIIILGIYALRNE